MPFQLDLSGNFAAALDGTKDLITISALLDLVSEDWLDRFARHIAARALPVYAALTYDGRIDFSPTDPLDAAIASAVNAHQRTDKGFGPALGPSAAAVAISRFKALGYSIVQGNSDWMIGTADQEIQVELLTGWANAAREIEALPRHDIDDWLTRRKSRSANAFQRCAWVTSTSSPRRAPSAEPTGRNRTAHRLRSCARGPASGGPGRPDRAAASRCRALRHPT